MADTVFISYAMKNQEVAERLVVALEGHGLPCWFAKRDIPLGASWPAEISKAISGSRLVLAVLSDDASKSEHLAREVGLAVEAHVPIFPLMIDDTPPSPTVAYFLANVQRELPPSALTDDWAATVARKISALLAPDATAQLEKLTVDDQLVAHEPPVHRSSALDVRITRDTPACMVLLVDCSNSMHHKIGGGDEHRRVLVAKAINDALRGLDSLAVGERGARPYFDVAVLGYGLGPGGTDVESLLPYGDGLISIVDISAHPPKVEQEERRISKPDGTVAVRTVPRKIWVDPVANLRGRTVARRAFLRAQELVDNWISSHPQSTPPIVLNITDGQYDRGEDPDDVVRAIQELATRAGNTLVFNCHLSDARTFQSRSGTVIFPSEDEAERFAGTMRRLYDQSSLLPPQMLQKARESDYQVREGARGYAYNADAAILFDFLEVGTQPMAPVR
jgi:TIR domain